MSFGAKGDEQINHARSGSKLKLDLNSGSNELSSNNNSSNPQLVKWTSGYDLTKEDGVHGDGVTKQDGIHGDGKGSVSSLGQRLRYPNATVEDLLPLRSEKQSLKPKGNYNR